MTMVSLKDIAAACGVSASTVSKALNDLDDISEKRKAMIRQKANEMGYLPNMAARALKTKMTHNIGVLFIDDYHSGLTHPYFAPVLESLKTEVENLGYDITFINKNVGGREMSYLEHCRYRNVDGVVIANVDFTKEEVVELVESDIPVVTIDHVFNNCPAVDARQHRQRHDGCRQQGEPSAADGIERSLHGCDLVRDLGAGLLAHEAGSRERNVYAENTLTWHGLR